MQAEYDNLDGLVIVQGSYQTFLGSIYSFDAFIVQFQGKPWKQDVYIFFIVFIQAEIWI